MKDLVEFIRFMFRWDASDPEIRDCFVEKPTYH